ncbi:MAG: hemolysin family protein [Candidatus Eisenbacteria bacterium]
MLLLALGLVLLNGFFVATEFALVKVRATRLAQLAAQGNASAAIAQEMVTHLDAYLSACQVGITLASLALGWIGEPAFAELLTPLFAPLGKAAAPLTHIVSVAVAFLIITVLHIVVGEQAPKILALARPEPMVLIVAQPMRLFYRVFYPFVNLLNRATRVLLAPLGVSGGGGEGHHSEEEARMILAESLAGGGDSENRRRLVERAFEFSQKRARQFMVPRADIVFLDITMPLAENMETARRMGFTRYPLVKGALDNVVGIVHIRDLTAGAGRLRSSEDLVRVAREPLFLPESSPADVVLRQFQSRRLHQAIVVDEYGGTSGLVTLEDLLEELIGSEIQDEFDSGEAPPLLALGGGSYSVAGGYALADLVDLLEETLDDPDEAVTVGGYVQNRLGRLGRVGDVVELGERHALQVLETRQRRVLRVLTGPRERILPQVSSGERPPTEAAASPATFD